MCSENETVKDVISQLQYQIQFESDTKSHGTEQEGGKRNWRVSWESSERVLMGKSLKSSPKHVPLSQAGIQHTSS